MKLLELFRRPAIGVDIGSRTIKGVKLRKSGNGLRLERYFFHDLAKTSRNFPEETNLAETLKADVEMNRLTNSVVAVNVKDEDVFNFNFSLPKMSQKEMKIAVAHEIQDSINIPITDLAFDYIVLDDANVALGEPVKVKAYCAKRESVIARTRILETSKLVPAAAESDVLAIMAMLEFNEYLAEGKNFAVFDLGESHVTTSLVSDMELVFSKTGKIGSGTINRELQNQLKIGYLESETVKLNHDFNEKNEEKVSDKIMDHVYFEMFKEAKESLQFFKEQLQPQGRIDRILLLGGGSQIRNIDKVFEMFFKIPTTIVNPFKNIQIYESAETAKDEEIAKIAPFMGTAVGLALREAA